MTIHCSLPTIIESFKNKFVSIKTITDAINVACGIEPGKIPTPDKCPGYTEIYFELLLQGFKFKSVEVEGNEVWGWGK